MTVKKGEENCIVVSRSAAMSCSYLTPIKFKRSSENLSQIAK